MIAVIGVRARPHIRCLPPLQMLAVRCFCSGGAPSATTSNPRTTTSSSRSIHSSRGCRSCGAGRSWSSLIFLSTRRVRYHSICHACSSDCCYKYPIGLRARSGGSGLPQGRRAAARWLRYVRLLCLALYGWSGHAARCFLCLIRTGGDDSHDRRRASLCCGL